MKDMAGSCCCISLRSRSHQRDDREVWKYDRYSLPSTLRTVPKFFTTICAKHILFLLVSSAFRSIATHHVGWSVSSCAQIIPDKTFGERYVYPRPYLRQYLIHKYSYAFLCRDCQIARQIVVRLFKRFSKNNRKIKIILQACITCYHEKWCECFKSYWKMIIACTSHFISMKYVSSNIIFLFTIVTVLTFMQLLKYGSVWNIRNLSNIYPILIFLY